MTSLYVGIDQSYSGFGLVCFDGIDHTQQLGTFLPEASDGSRLERVQDWLIEQIESVQDGRPISACMEGYAPGAKFGREKAGELGGIVKLVLHQFFGVAPVMVAPTQLKKFVTGKGQGGKNDIMLAAYKRYGVEFGNDNLTDAYVLARIAHALDAGPGLPAFQVEVLAKLRLAVGLSHVDVDNVTRVRCVTRIS